jgi:hypothetical protein
MSAWVLVLVVMATSMSNNYPFDEHSNTTDRIVGVEVNSVTHAPSVVTIDFSDKTACETAVKTLQDADSFGTTKATCIARQ